MADARFRQAAKRLKETMARKYEAVQTTQTAGPIGDGKLVIGGQIYDGAVDGVTTVVNVGRLAAAQYAPQVGGSVVTRGSGSSATTGTGGTGTDVSSLSLITLNPESALTNERYLAVSNALSLTDGGAGAPVTIGLETPLTLSASSVNDANTGSHQILASANPGAAEWLLKSDPTGLLTLPQLTATSKVRTPLIDTASGGITISPANNTTTINGNVTVQRSGAATTVSLYAPGDAGSNYPRVALHRARNVQGSELAVAVNDILGAISFRGHDGLAYPTVGNAEIRAVAAENFTATAEGTTLRFLTTALGSATLAERMRIHASGNLSVLNTTDSGFALDVTGTARASTSLTTPLLTTATNVDLMIDPAGTGAVKFANAQTIRTTTFDGWTIPYTTGFQINEYAPVPGGSASVLTIGRIQADELDVRVFVANETRVDRGDEFWTKSFGIVAENFVTPATIGSTVSVKFENSPALAGAIFANNDWLLIRKLEIGTGLSLFNVWGQVNTYTNNGDGTQTWTFTLRGGPTNKLIDKGSLGIDFGQAGAGLIHLSVVDASGSPYIKLRKWVSGSDPMSINGPNFKTYVQIGNLGSISNSYYTPVGFGWYVQSAANDGQFIIADDNGLQLRGADFKEYNGANQTVNIASADGSLKLGTNVASATTTGFEFNGTTGAVTIGNASYAATVTVYGQIVIKAGSSGYGNMSDRPTNLSGINSTEGTKLAGIQDNATVGATWGTNLNSIPTRFGSAPSSAGLYLTPTHLGYYNGSAWKAWIAETGEFYFGGSSGAHLEWDGARLQGIGTDGTTKQWYAESASGKLFAGAGSVVLSATGIDLQRYSVAPGGNPNPTDNINAIAWWPNPASIGGSDTPPARIWGYTNTNGAHGFQIDVNPGSSLGPRLWIDGNVAGSPGYVTSLWLSNIDSVNGIPGFYAAKGSGGDLVRLSGKIEVQSNVLPTSDNTLNLGSASFRFKTIYADQVIASAISGTAMSGQEWEYAGSMTIDANSASTTTVSIVNQGTGQANLDVDNNITLGGTVDGVDLSGFKASYDAHVAGSDVHTIYLLSSGARAGATSQAQEFNNGLVAIAPSATVSQLTLRSARAAIASTNVLGGVDFQSNDTSLTTPGIVTARIQAVANVAHTTTALGTDLVFSTTAGTTLSEAMRIGGNKSVTLAGTLTAPSIKNSLIAFGGQGANDLSMIGVLYDRNELALADVRGTVSVNITGAGSVTTNTIGNAFDISGGYLSITGTDNTTSQIVIHIDLGANQANYSSAFWQPFLQYRLGMNGVYTHYRTIVCEVSADNTTWYKPADGSWETTSAHTSEIVPGLWLGKNGNPAIPGSVWRYARFTLSSRFEDAGYASKASLWISQVGLRHYASRATRALVSTRGDTVYGPLVIRNTGAAALTVQNASGTALLSANTNTATVTVTGDLSVTDNVLMAMGSAALPALAGSGDLDTGIYLPTANTLAVATGGVQRFTIGTTSIDSSLPVNVTGSLTATVNVQANSSLISPLLTTASGNLTIAGSADILLDPTSNIVKLTSGVVFQSDNFASQSTGLRLTHSGEIDARYIYTDEMHAKAFIADLEQALAGGQIIAKSVAVLYSAFTAPAAGATASLTVRDLPSATGMAVFVNGDFVRIRSFARSGGSLTIGDCWGTVVLDGTYGVSGFDSSTKTQRYTFTRSTAPNAGAMASGTVVAADAIILDYGTSGNGFYEVNAIDGAYGANSPYAQIVTWTGHPRTQIVRARLGNLFGIFAQAGEHGLYAGDGTGITNQYLRIGSAGVQLNNIPLRMFNGADQTVNLSQTGTDFWIGPNSTDKRIAWDGTTMTIVGAVTITGGNAAKTDFSNITATLDNVPNGTTYARTTPDQVTGAARAFTALNGSNSLVTSVIPATAVGNPGVAGLYLGSDYMGYHNGNGAATGWKTYMDSSGNFRFAGSASNNYIQWSAASNKLQGVGSTVEQWYADATNGKLYAGGGAVWLDVNGANFNVLAAGATPSSLRFTSGTTLRGAIGFIYTAGPLPDPTDGLVFYNATGTKFRFTGAGSTEFSSTVNVTGSVTATSGMSVGGVAVSLSNHNHDSTYLALTGGTLTGTLIGRTIQPSTNNLYDLGTTALYFNHLYVRNLHTDMIVGTPNYSHDHNDLYYTEVESDSRYLQLTGGTLTGSVTIDADAAGTNALVRIRTDNPANKYWQMVGYAVDHPTVSVQNDLRLQFFDGATTYTIWHIDNTTRVFDFTAAPTVGGVAVSLSNHNHDSSYVPLTRSVLAGAGLIGGGVLSANVTLSHADTSTVADVTNTNGNVLRNITFDTYGHVQTISSFDLDGRYYTEGESDARFTLITTYNAHVANVNAHHAQQHSVTGSDHTVTGAAQDVVGLVGTNTLGLLTPSANPGAASTLLKSDGVGALTLTTVSATTRVRTSLVDTLSGNISIAPGGVTMATITTTGMGVGTSAPDGLQVQSAVAEVSRGVPNVRLGVASGTPRINFDDGTNQWEIDNSGGTLRFFKPGNVLIDVDGTGNTRLYGGNLGSGVYASQTTGWRVTGNGGADFRNLYTDELHAKALIADLEQALAGLQIISKSVAVVATDFTVPFAGAQSRLTVRDLPSAPGMATFQNNDYVALRTFNRVSGSLSIGYVWGQVFNRTNNGDGTQTWTFLRSGITTYNSIVMRGTATSGSSSAATSRSVTKPTGTVQGDVLVAVVTHDGAADVITASGWTLLQYASGSNINAGIYYKVAGASEPSSYTFSTVNSHAIGASIVAYNNVSTTAPIDAFTLQVNGTGANMAAPAAWSTSSQGRVLFLGGVGNSSSITPASGMTELVDTGSTGIRVYVAEESMIANGSTGVKTATISSSSYASIAALVVLRPTYNSMTADAGSVTPASTIAADALALDYGVSGNGYHEVNAIDGTYGVNSPYSQIVTWTGHPATGQVVRTRTGNLFGLFGVAGEHGFYAGNGTTANSAYVRLSSATSEFANVPISMYSAGIKYVGLDTTTGLDLKIGSSQTEELPSITWRSTVGTGNPLARASAWDSGTEVSIGFTADAPSTARSARVSLQANNADSPTGVAGLFFRAPATGQSTTGQVFSDTFTITGSKVVLDGSPMRLGIAVATNQTYWTAGSWTASNWRKALVLTPTDNLIFWPKTTLGSARGIVNDGANWRFVRSAADDTSAAAVTDLLIDNNGKVTIGSTLDSVTGTINLSGNVAITGTLSTSGIGVGNVGIDYTPTIANWGGVGSTILLNGLNYTTIGFHDSNNRVDFIRVGAGIISLGYDGGFGSANVVVDGNLGVGVAPSYRLDVNGAAHATSFPTSSDARLKVAVTPITGVLDRLEKIGAYRFYWSQNYRSYDQFLDDKGQPLAQIGVMAQEVQAQFPELVSTWTHTGKDGTVIENTLAVDYARIVPLLLAALRELRLEVAHLRSQIQN